MRNYKFRGKRKDNGEWVYGNYVSTDPAEAFILIGVTGHIKRDDYECYMVEVIPETVGMWTGIKDIEGNDIYDGDIVLTKKFWKYRFSDNKRWKRFYGLVVFDVSQTTGEAGWDVEVKDQEDYDYEAYGPFDDCKVISNIHDQPKLLNPAQGNGPLNTMNIDPNVKEEEVKQPADAAPEQATEDSEEGTTEG